MKRIHYFENLHILLWLLKDICWLLEWKIAGTIMIIPTISLAIFLTIKSYPHHLFWINLATCFWISANGYWMLCEFSGRIELKNYAAFPFSAGLISVFVFFLNNGKNPSAITQDEL